MRSGWGRCWAAVWALACGAPGEPAIVTVGLEPAELVLHLGFAQQFSVTPRDGRGAVVDAAVVGWQSTDPGVVVVNGEGVATAVAPGRARVIARVVGGPAAVALVTVPPLAFASIAPGNTYTCGVTVEDLAYCWGNNLVGQLGDGTEGDIKLTPGPVAGGIRFRAVSAQYMHTCGLTPAGAAYCWGRNFTGRPGAGTPPWGHVLTPAPVVGDLTFAAIHVGGWFLCGLTPGGEAYCWGQNDQGSVGDGTTMDRRVPVPVAGGHRFAALTTGGLHACGITLQGAGYCWGRNQVGALGDGTTIGRSEPVAVSGGLVFKSLSAGVGLTCGVASDGVAYCWGENYRGALGDGTETDRLEPTPVAGGLRFQSVQAGGLNSCGLAVDGRAYCWGDNASGKLGRPRRELPMSTVPVLVTDALRFRWLAVDGAACGEAMDGIVYCWGSNGWGQLGIGTANIGSYVPVPIWGQK